MKRILFVIIIFQLLPAIAQAQFSRKSTGKIYQTTWSDTTVLGSQTPNVDSALTAIKGVVVAHSFNGFIPKQGTSLSDTTLGYVAGRDSFATTLTADTVSVAGVTVNSLPFIRQLTPTWSTAIDTAIYVAHCESGTLIVKRAKSYVVAGGTFKSGAQYDYFIKK